MRSPTKNGLSISDVESKYDTYLPTARGLSRSTRNLHHHVVHRLLSSRFPSGNIDLSKIRFNDFVQFLTSEFAWLHNRGTQTTWLMILRSFVRYLAREGRVPSGWDAALPSIGWRGRFRGQSNSDGRELRLQNEMLTWKTSQLGFPLERPVVHH
jgi:hypothetical protein